ncbi:MAG: N-acetyl-gamma-glutamyl-phosphate reductase [Lachnospiraceae bacterium]|nr:N-acetyl-gamma-glutamyl-phosphate reductase [Lachnospiraceae bacterium]
MKTRVYIDGQAGTTGLQIYDRISQRGDLELMMIAEEKRHDLDERKKFLNEADIVFLCLPDDAAKESVSLIENENVKVIDASTAHRTNDAWDYGFPELSKEQRAKIAVSKRVANPGCHATGSVATIAPLVKMGILPADYPVSIYSLTGYSGGGKKMIADYESESRDITLSSPSIYGRTLKHKHVPEITKVAGLKYAPAFLPVVDDYYKGMATTVMLQSRLLSGNPSAKDICEKLAEYYKDEALVNVKPFEDEPGKIYANTLAGRDDLEIFVYGYEDLIGVTALFDNLGKGASGAAVQNMNIMLGIDEKTGLNV